MCYNNLISKLNYYIITYIYMSFFTKYLKYKNKYLDLKKIIGGAVAGVVSDTINTTNKFIEDANAQVIKEHNHEIRSIRIIIDGKPVDLSINDCIKYNC